jgi:hypothetical protein
MSDRKRGEAVDESVWQSCTRLWEMLPLVEKRLSDRKRRLFAVACCKRLAHLFLDERSRKALEVAERYADGLASEEELLLAEDAAVDAHIAARESRFAADSPLPWSRRSELLTQAALLAVSPGIYYAGDTADSLRLALAAGGAALQEQAEEVLQCRLLRDIAGPLRPVRLDPLWPAWNDQAALRMAEWIDEKGAFEDLPYLADALEEAGCSEPLILDHCRHEGEHVHGCWVVDLVRSV